MVVEEQRSAVVCANPDCRVAETGRCVEGLALTDCPHYGREAEDKGGDGVTVEAEKSAVVALPAAGTLTPGEASGILRHGPARVVAIVGPRDSGKTSLIAAVYDLFQEGPVRGMQFSGSRTLHGLEHVCHDARAESQRGVPHMNRTPRGEVRFYHLEIGGAGSGDRVGLLLGDRAGEEYREAGDDISVVTSFNEVARADGITVLVDGERLLGAGRHNLRSDILMMLQGFLEGGMLRRECRLALVLTKLDAVRGHQAAERALADFDRLLADVRRLFGHLASPAEPFRVAASPKTGDFPRGAGVGELLSYWLEAPDAPVNSVPGQARHPRAFARLRALEAAGTTDG
jgi:hypothetical protein